MVDQDKGLVSATRVVHWRASVTALMRLWRGSKGVAPQILIVLFLIYLFDNIIQLISLRNLWYYGGW
jgi:hypothetical protein